MKILQEGEELLERFGVPKDAAKGETLLTFLGSGAVLIENYRSILLYSETCVRIQGRRSQLEITGKNLCIRYYDKDEMKITGRMETVIFEAGRGRHGVS